MMHRRLQALGRLKPGTMNRTEARYEAEVLKPALMAGEILWYSFEGVKLRLAGNTFLTMDFPVLRADGLLAMIDVKGGPAVITDDARVKMKVAAEAFPFAFSMVWPRSKARGGGWEVVEI